MVLCSFNCYGILLLWLTIVQVHTNNNDGLLEVTGARIWNIYENLPVSD